MQGFTEALRTPDSTLIFVAPEKAEEIHAGPGRTAWAASASAASPTGRRRARTYDNGKKADPRSFCIQKTLQDIAHAAPDDEAALENNLMFAGHNAYRFASDPFYSQRLHPDGARTGGAHPDRQISPARDRAHRSGRN